MKGNNAILLFKFNSMKRYIYKIGKSLIRRLGIREHYHQYNFNNQVVTKYDDFYV